MISSLIFIIVGFAGCAASFIVPHERNFSVDQSLAAGVLGSVFLLMCFILAIRFTF